ncbi:TetR/AcrR family transcriptional regulator [uncultured Roseibium sp.]|uniref:TetR/AcrR family transcriptional regulator n=1 Tax=uncultured Roseibium sp. TaxID=1936171 RepID=UPI00262ECE18|nr:TetR/AcrR family transcriptional regulator [uncultured Roseibium sp.]
MKTLTKRGRPRKFDEEQTLDLIMQVFWQHGYSATSLDQIAEATGLNRPSLYAAFGTKKDMFLKSIERFADRMEAHLRDAGSRATGVNARMKDIMAAAVDLYTGKSDLTGAAHGCLAISTLPSEALQDSDFQLALGNVLLRMDTGFARLILRESKGAVREAHAKEIAQHLALVLHGLSIRARAGENPEKLKRLSSSAVDRLISAQASALSDDDRHP